MIIGTVAGVDTMKKGDGMKNGDLILLGLILKGGTGKEIIST